jgi:predicted hotdog family 3-hydroxylacyl-ACP dehydratase
MRLDRAWIESHIPHQGRMCLLDEVLEWDAERIRCRGTTHRAADHPLSGHGRLGIACGIEYAAQAMAVHAALSGGAMAADGAEPGAPTAGFLASVRGVRFYALRLDDVRDDLTCNALRIAGDQGTALYEFDVRAGATCLLRGRASVVLDAADRLPPR